VDENSTVYIRFVVGADGDRHRELTGIFTEARLLRERDRMTYEESARLDGIYSWFNDHVPVPPFATADLPRDVRAWFKDDAVGPVSRMWDIVALLREHGTDVRLLRSANPGRILYEDDVQVVVEEWNAI